MPLRISKGTRVAGNDNARPAQEAAAAPDNEAGDDNMRSHTTPRTDLDGDRPVSAEPASLQPSELLNREAMRGKFSLLSVLGTDHEGIGAAAEDASVVPPQDAIRIGLVSQSIAEFLFASFINILNPYISQLDPLLHTFSYVRQRSSFLLCSILAVSAKMFNPALYEPLHKHAEDLFVDGFRQGTKSVETAQAILILTYWKEPEDTRSWVTLGYVIRMCMDLGWHKLAPRSIRERDSLTTTQLREVRNIERTWFVLFVYDRSMSLQTGKPWMIERNRFIETIEPWCKDPTATHNDVLLGAFVTLRLLTSEVFRLLGSRRQIDTYDNISSFLTIINSRIDEWESKWLQLCGNESESCHPFLIRFYGTHLRLQLYSLPLQEVLGSASHDVAYNLETLWESYSGAINMLKLVSLFSSRLYFAQDSVHIMTAYSAAFLIKLLLSAPASIVREIEAGTIETIRTAATAFSQQSAPPGSSCFLQARFLDKVVSNYDDIREQNSPRGVSATTRTDICYHSNLATPGTGTRETMTAPSALAEGSCDSIYTQQQAYEENSLPRTFITTAQSSSAVARSTARIDCILTDNDTWADVFANAGFNIQDGFFFS